MIVDKDLLNTLRLNHWISAPESVIYPNYVFSRIEPSTISFKALGNNAMSIISIVLLNCVHIVVNLPAFKMATGINFNFSNELGAQGFSNLFTIIPCYFIVSYSIAAVKSGGNKKMYSYVAAAAMVLIVLYGVFIKAFVPKF